MGSKKCAAYSSLGRTKVLYATSLVQMPISCKVLVAFGKYQRYVEPIDSMFSVIVIPRYFAD